jgi:hypothetical protein
LDKRADASTSALEVQPVVVVVHTSLTQTLRLILQLLVEVAVQHKVVAHTHPTNPEQMLQYTLRYMVLLVLHMQVRGKLVRPVE